MKNLRKTKRVYHRKPKSLLSTTRGSILFLVLIISLLLLGGHYFNTWLHTPYLMLQSKPIKFNVEASSSANFQKFVEDSKYHDIVVKIRELESNQGKNKNGGLHLLCANKGMWNEVGYRAKEGFCFTGETEGNTVVQNWFKREMQTLTEGQAVCLYNTGYPTNTCEYYENFRTLEI